MNSGIDQITSFDKTQEINLIDTTPHKIQETVSFLPHAPPRIIINLLIHLLVKNWNHDNSLKVMPPQTNVHFACKGSACWAYCGLADRVVLGRYSFGR